MNYLAKGALASVISSLPISIIFALVYRFPVPFGGYVGPFSGRHRDFGIFEVLTLIPIAWVFYGILGGFVVLSIGGALTGATIESIYHSESKERINRLVYLGGLGMAILGVGFLSILDYIIGPW